MNRVLLCAVNLQAISEFLSGRAMPALRRPYCIMECKQALIILWVNFMSVSSNTYKYVYKYKYRRN